jgi:putative membrane protein
VTEARELQRAAGWRRLDSRMLLVHPVNELIRFLPLVIGFFFVGSSQEGSSLYWHIGGIAVPILLGIMRFATTSFRITGSQIELRRGLISRNVLTAPIDRVRTVELTASPIHRILGLAKVKIGTGSASKSGSEKLELDSLRGHDARALRVELLHRSREVSEVSGVSEDSGVSTSSTAGTGSTTSTGSTTGALIDDIVLLRLDPAWVRYAPLTTSGLLIAFGALAATNSFLARLVNDVNGSELTTRVKESPVWLSVLVGLVIVIVVISVLSALGYILTNWGFTLSRDRNGRSFHIRRGLLTTRETSLDKERVRGLEIHEPLGLRLAGAGHLSAIVTGLDRRSRGSSPLVPPAPTAVVVGVGEAVLEETGPFTAALLPHGPAARRRRYARALSGAAVLPVFLVVGWLAWDWPPWLVPVSLLVFVAATALARDRYAGLGHALTSKYLIVRSGSFRGRRDALQRSGIIGWNIRQSWFQKRVGVVRLTATTSAGKQAYTAYDLSEGVAIALADEAVPGLLRQFLRAAS